MLSVLRRYGADFTGGATPSPAVIFFVAFACAALWPREAWAMHLADGMLPVRWWLVWTLVATPFVALAWRTFDLQRLRDEREAPLLAMVAAAVFAISCMPVPIPLVGSCAHPCGTGLAAILVGRLRAVLLTAIALLLQALFLAHGGLTTLGADIVSMGIAGGFTGYAVYRVARRLGLGVAAAAFLAGVLADWATYATTSLQLTLALRGDSSLASVFGGLCLAFAPTQLPLGLFEGAMTAGALASLSRRRAGWSRRLPGGAEEAA
jgi:cobalt/nickel transport system permease protein